MNREPDQECDARGSQRVRPQVRKQAVTSCAEEISLLLELQFTYDETILDLTRVASLGAKNGSRHGS
jgi:hypothetical protein